ncbi:MULTISPECIES: XisH family protein [Nostocales]|uniref:FdxN element excision controlling factor protein n=2 Tax=Dolichospermum TaxID=748770 RepID=A0A480AA03_9CYAN|nr:MULTISPECIES: XisH family protein [Nostocales]MBD2268533.1 XisH family protein [Anabaena sp. FACHB-1391]MBE9218153.1 XisH family protein [Dolichospermum flos-aquae LEGE 04289]GCL41747.1 fdxN element excision controlling factor protein [Dolichospermum planctonicum]
MSAKDIFHNTVKIALEKENWQITDDPLYLRLTALVKIRIDLGAEKLIGAEKDNQKIAVEVKSFLGLSAISEFHTAIGQFLNYRIALGQQDPERVLYLAISQDIYQEFFTDSFIQTVLQTYEIKLLVFDINKEAIVLWKP